MQADPPSQLNPQPFAGLGSLPDPGPKDWWTSRTIFGVAMALVPPVLHWFHINIAADDPAIGELVNALLTLIGSGLAIYGRAKATRPLTLGVKPADIAASLLLFTFTALAVLILGGCAAPGQRRPRLSDSIETVGLTASYGDGEQTVSVGTTVKLRDTRGYAK